MPRELPVNWSEIEKACLAGVPQRQVAKAMAESVGIDQERLYKAIRKRASRERWALPDAIVRRAQAQARVAAGVAEDTKQGSKWQKGVSGFDAVQLSRDVAGVGVPHDIVDRISGELGVASSPAGVAVVSGGDVVGFGVGGGLTTSPPSATELVTQSLAARGQTGLSMALDAALASLQALKASGDALPIRSQTDLLTNVKALQAAAGLDKPQVAIAVSLNSGQNASIAAWESIESENLSQM